MSQVKFIKGNSFSLLNSFRDNVSCNQCHQFSPDSVILPCSHIFCNKCIYKSQGLLRKVFSSTISCSICPKKYYSSITLEKNFLAEQIACTEKVKDYFSKDGACTDCLIKPAEVANYYCGSCTKYLCEHDFEAHRKYTSGAQHHAIVSKFNMTCLVSTSVPMETHPTHFGPCPRHHTALLEFFCEKDHTLGCAICITAEHHGHDLLKPSHALSTSVQELDKTLMDLDEEINLFLSEKKRLSSMKEKLEGEENSVNQKINIYYDDLMKKMQARKATEIETVKKTFSKSRNTIFESLELISSVVSHLSQAQNILKMTRTYTPPATMLEKSHFLKIISKNSISEVQELKSKFPQMPEFRIIPDFGIETGLELLHVCREICKLRAISANQSPLEIRNPVGVAIDEKQQTYVIDTKDARVHVFSETGQFQRYFKIDSNWLLGIDEIHPWGVAVRNETLYVSDIINKCVNVYDANGVFIAIVGVPSCEDSNSELQHPEGLFVTEDDWLYVADQWAGAVKVYDGGEKENFALKQVIRGEGKNALKEPWDVNIVQREIIVLDEGNPCLHIFSLRGDYLRSVISRVPKGNMEFPLFFAYSSADDSYIFTDTELRRAFKYSSRGNLLYEYPIQFERPGGVAVSSLGRIIFADTNANTVYAI
ncbi:hypothetical protein LOD99_5004 [Oopsacas minuta]|uniref:RING-type domain-containing protein n=1 Tax=Oopsacas minuta TaxID=111878 RepID=A0AAV7JS95_9METZ|nr:hypothetical protein LOD99_5004 [Oopsacas minuta]